MPAEDAPDHAEAVDQEKVTGFRPERRRARQFRETLPGLPHPAARMGYADNETDYCLHCQAEVRLLVDHGLSRLLRCHWQRTIANLQRLRR